MPTHNRPRNLAALLASLDNQTLENFEVLVVDDNSNPPAQVPTLPNLTLLRTEGIERCRARNLGANQARGEVLLFLDDDLTFGPDFLALHVEAHQKTLGAVVVGGLELPTTAKNTPFGRFRFEMERQNAPPAGEVKTPTFATANLSLSRADFLALEGFDAQILCGEDQDLLARAQTRGTKLFFLPQALTIHHDHAVDLETYLKRMEWGAKNMAGLYARYPDWPGHIRRQQINGPLKLGRESLRRSLLKISKAAPVVPFLVAVAHFLERQNPKSRFLPPIYRFLIGAAIQRGFRAAGQL